MGQRATEIDEDQKFAAPVTFWTSLQKSFARSFADSPIDAARDSQCGGFGIRRGDAVRVTRPHLPGGCLVPRGVLLNCIRETEAGGDVGDPCLARREACRDRGNESIRRNSHEFRYGGIGNSHEFCYGRSGNSGRVPLTETRGSVGRSLTVSSCGGSSTCSSLHAFSLTESTLPRRAQEISQFAIQLRASAPAGLARIVCA